MQIRLKKKRNLGGKYKKSIKNGHFIKITTLIYLTDHLNIGMQCSECGLLLDSVDESQIEKYGRFSKPDFYCEAHKPLHFIEA